MKTILIYFTLLFFNCSVNDLFKPDNGEIKIISITPSDVYVSDSTKFSITYSYTLKDVNSANVVIKGNVNHPDSSIFILNTGAYNVKGENTISFKLLIPSGNLSKTIIITAVLEEDTGFFPMEYDSDSKAINLLR